MVGYDVPVIRQPEDGIVINHHPIARIGQLSRDVRIPDPRLVEVDQDAFREIGMAWSAVIKVPERIRRAVPCSRTTQEGTCDASASD